MQRIPFFGLAGVFVCLLMGGCHTAGRCPGGCPGGSCPSPGAVSAPYSDDAYGTPQGSGGRPQPNNPSPMFQGSGSR